MAHISPPTGTREVREFLGTADFFRLWILDFAELAAPLYPVTKATIPFSWGEDQQQAFDKINKALLLVPALSLPDVMKPFTLYVDDSKGVAKGVLTQRLGSWKKPGAYISKKMDNVVTGCPSLPPHGSHSSHPGQKCR